METFSYYCPFLKGIHWSSVDSPNAGFWVFICCQPQRAVEQTVSGGDSIRHDVVKQSISQWYETLMWRHRNILPDPDHMPSGDCRNSYRARKLDGAVILSRFDSLYVNSACIMRFKADGSTFLSPSKFLVRFERWDVEDCSVILQIYNGDASSIAPSVRIPVYILLTCHFFSEKI